MSTPPLRPYQEQQIQALREAFRKGHRRVILCAPTGSGKTRTFTEIVYSTLRRGDKRVLVVTDRIELFKQTLKAINTRGIATYTFDSDAQPLFIQERCILGMIETIKRRAKKDPEAFHAAVGKVSLIIIDEAHKGNFQEVFDIWPDVYVIGATATPVSTRRDQPLSTWYQDIVNLVDIPALIADGYLAEAQHYAMMEVDMSSLKSRNGEYTTASLEAVFGGAMLFKGVEQGLREHGHGKKSIVFCPSVKSTKDLHASLVQEGLRAVYVVSDSTPEEREAAIRAFHGQEADVMVNCGILTTGYDFPPIEVVVMNRATQSIPLWLQCCGRGSRIAEGKKSFKILDYGRNIERLGRWDSTYPWDTLWKRKVEKKTIEREERDPVTRNAMKMADGQLVYMPGSRDLNGLYVYDLEPHELERLCLLRGYKKRFAEMVALAKGTEFYLEFARYKRYSDYYVEQQLRKPTPTVKNFKVRL